jgi:phage shock protein A
MAGKIDQMEAEAEAQSEIQEEYTGDILAHKFSTLEKTSGADEDLVALKRKMGMLPPEQAPAVRAETPKRVEAPSPSPSARNEQDELAAALEEMEAEQVQEQQRKAGR